VFVRKVPGRTGSTKVQIAERRGGRDVVLEHLGTARSGAELAALVAEARRRLRPGQDALDLRLEAGVSSGRGVITAKASAVLWSWARHMPGWASTRSGWGVQAAGAGAGGGADLESGLAAGAGPSTPSTAA